MSPRAALATIVLIGTMALSGCFAGADDGTLRLGYFPNLTHAQALYGLQTGIFEAHLTPAFQLAPVAFNAGPAAMEALLAGTVDATYVGPTPTLNAMTAVKGVVIIVAGAASGGARFIVQPEMAGADVSAFAGKTLATPGLGNTQDVSLKHYLQQHGLRSKDIGGNVQVLNAQNPDILTLFAQGDIAGAWVPEPWAVRLEKDAGGVEYLDEADLWPDGDFVTTHLVTTKDYLQRHPDAIAALLDAHVEATLKVQEGGPDVLDAINDGIEAATGKRLGDALLAESFPRVRFTYDPLASTFYAFAEQADDLGFLRGRAPPAADAYDVHLLAQVLDRRNLDPVPQP